MVPPSVHVNGNKYQWANKVRLAPLRGFLLPLLLEAPGRQVISGEKGMISKGKRNATLTSIGGTLRRVGLCREAIFECLLIIKKYHVDPPIQDHEIEKISASLSRYAPGTIGAVVPYQPGEIGAFLNEKKEHHFG